jgi:large subunit ribosomal protein L9
MRVVFLEDVAGVARGGDIKDVKSGFARNYLIPKRLAAPASHDALQRVQKLTLQAEDARLKRLEDMRALGEELNGERVNVGMRAGVSGRLYGSVTNAIIAEALSELTGREIDRRTVDIADPIRELGTHNVGVRLHPEVDATISVLVHPLDSDPEEYLASLESANAEQEPDTQSVGAEQEPETEGAANGDDSESTESE